MAVSLRLRKKTLMATRNERMISSTNALFLACPKIAFTRPVVARSQVADFKQPWVFVYRRREMDPRRHRALAVWSPLVRQNGPIARRH